MPRCLVRCGLPLLMAFAVGCSGSKMPGLHSAEGKVVRDGQPVADAIVQFIPQDERQAADLTITGRTDSDGRFRVSTIEGRTNRKKSGAPEGWYEVAITLPINDKQGGGGEFKVPGQVLVEKGGSTFPPFDVAATKKKEPAKPGH